MTEPWTAAFALAALGYVALLVLAVAVELRGLGEPVEDLP